MIKVHHNGCGAIGGNDTMGRTRGGNNSKITIEPLHFFYTRKNLYFLGIKTSSWDEKPL